MGGVVITGGLVRGDEEEVNGLEIVLVLVVVEDWIRVLVTLNKEITG